MTQHLHPNTTNDIVEGWLDALERPGDTLELKRDGIMDPVLFLSKRNAHTQTEAQYVLSRGVTSSAVKTRLAARNAIVTALAAADTHTGRAKAPCEVHGSIKLPRQAARPIVFSSECVYDTSLSVLDANIVAWLQSMRVNSEVGVDFGKTNGAVRVRRDHDKFLVTITSTKRLPSIDVPLSPHEEGLLRGMISMPTPEAAARVVMQTVFALATLMGPTACTYGSVRAAGRSFPFRVKPTADTYMSCLRAFPPTTVGSEASLGDVVSSALRRPVLSRAMGGAKRRRVSRSSRLLGGSSRHRRSSTTTTTTPRSKRSKTKSGKRNARR